VPEATSALGPPAPEHVGFAESAADRYRRDGFLFPIDVLTAAEADAVVREIEETKAQYGQGGLPQPLGTYFRLNAHIVMPFAAALARHPAVLDAVAGILGDDLLVWSVEFFIKPPHSRAIVSWHQDLTYWGMGETDDEVTAWIALTPALPESGGMRFVAGSHRQPMLPHRDSFADDNLLSRGQELAVDVVEAEAIDVVLRPGQMSLHHGKMFHASGPNRAAWPRIACAIRYLRPDVRQHVAAEDFAMTVRGMDRLRNFIPVAGAVRSFSPDALALHDRIREAQVVALGHGAGRAMRDYGRDTPAA